MKSKGTKGSKKDQILASWLADRTKTKGQFFQQIAQDRSTITGKDSILLCYGKRRPIVGVPFPALALEYFFDSTVLSLDGAMSLVVGDYQTCKSSFFFEMIRWFGRSGGGGVVQENETKFSEILCASINRWDMSGVVVERSGSVESWQSGLTHWINATKTKCLGTRKEPGPGRIVPVILGVDSVVGKLTQANQEKIEKAGYAEAAFPKETLLISRFLKTCVALAEGWPFHVVIVNQMRRSHNTDGTMTMSRAGGKTIDFQASYEIEISRQRFIHQVSREGVSLLMKMRKNSFGSPDRALQVDMVWWNSQDTWVDEQGGKHRATRQHTKFDWFSATMDVLLRESQSGVERRNAIRDICGFQFLDASQGKVRKVWSKKLGHSGPKDSVDLNTAGQLLHKDKTILNQLRELFGIKIGFVFQPGEDYQEQLKTASAQVTDEEVQRMNSLLTDKTSKARKLGHKKAKAGMAKLKQSLESG